MTKLMVFDFWARLWASHRARAGLVDPDWEEFRELYCAFEPTEMEYRGG